MNNPRVSIDPDSGDAVDVDRLLNGPLVSTLEGWRGAALPLSISENDLELLDLVLCVYPELRIVLYLGQLARRHGLTYPVENVDRLTALIGDDSFELGEHRIDASEIARAMPREWFPLSHEGDLLTAAHRALLGCSSREAAARIANLGGIPAGDTIWSEHGHFQ